MESNNGLPQNMPGSKSHENSSRESASGSESESGTY
jgi:hypothetical protein